MDATVSIEAARAAVWIIPVFLAVHELEEWNILEWYKRYFTDLPASTDTSVRIHILMFCAAAFLLTLIASVAPPIVAGLWVVFVSGFVLTNTLQHVIQTFQYRAYAPGAATGILCTAACAYVNALWARNGMIFPPFYLIFLSGIPAVANTVRLKHRMTPEVRRVHEFFIGVENHIRGNIGRIER